jgi:hypothetical protein
MKTNSYQLSFLPMRILSLGVENSFLFRTIYVKPFLKNIEEQ